MRLLYCAFDRVPAPKGASRHILAFVEGLTQAGVEVDLCCLTPPELTRIAGARCLPPPPRAPSILDRALAFGRLAASYARQGHYQLIQFRSPWEGLELVRWPGHPPLLFEVNGLPSIEWPLSYPALTKEPQLIAKLQHREDAVLKAVEGVITPSPVTASWLQARGAKRVAVIANGVDGSAWGNAPRQPEMPPEVFYMGTFSPWQGLDTAIDALALLPAPIKLRLVGPRDRGDAGRLLRTAQALGVGDRLLIQPAVAPGLLDTFLARAAVAIAPLADDPRNRRQGACPIKLLEYLAAGCPVVASRLPLVEALVSHGEDAWLVPPDDPTALATGIAALLDDPALAARLARLGRQLAERHSWANAVAQLQAVHGALLNRPGLPPGPGPWLG
ncbi:MAG: glycosyltransferase family 4 protein [Candidatus Competibacterales bacterium]